MKNIFILVFFFFSLNSFAKKIEVDVVSAEFGIEDQNDNKSLCLTVVRVPTSGKLLGLVENIYDCFYARKGKKVARLIVEMNDFKKISSPDLKDHLQRIDTQLEFLFSLGE